MVAFETKTLHQAILKWGEDSQMEMIVEECAELIQAIQKYKRKPSSETIEHIAEELADVQIMLYQAKVIFACDAKMEEFIEQKIARLKERLKA